jgi:octaprenyl-diphosphate synthase
VASDDARPDLLELARRVAAPDLIRVDAFIRARLDSDVALIRQMSEYLIQAGGKRLRPLLVLLGARAAGYQGDQHIALAAVIEFIHSATLLHDDVVDESDLRRGRQTANAVWGNAASVLVGDFLYSRAFQLMVEVDSREVMRILADTTNAIAEGEVLQLLNLNNPATDEAAYFRVIERKTARLFDAACRLGAALAGHDVHSQARFGEIGLKLGIAFQLTDDALDYDRASGLGKQVGDDLAEGKPTLPLIHALKHANADEALLLETAIREGGRERLDAVLEVLKRHLSIDYTYAQAQAAATRAEAIAATLPESDASRAIAALARYAGVRS